MSAVLRTWLGFLALGAGLVHFALVIGSPLPVAFVLLLVGAAEFVWGVFAFVRSTPPVPMLARSGALVPVIGWALLLLVAGTDSFGPLTSPDRLMPMLVASLFDLLIAGGLTALLRRASVEQVRAASETRESDAAPAPTGTEHAPAHPARYLVAVILGALVIAAITMPALAATEAGRAAGSSNSSTFDFSGHDH